MRPIDADKLIQFVDYSAGLGGLWGRLLTAFKTVIKEVVNVQPTIGPEAHWIPCYVRLPDKADHKEDMVLVWYENGAIRFNAYRNGWVQGDPIAWMPLPEPYKEGDVE